MVEFPSVFVYEDDDREDHAAEALADFVANAGIRSPFVVASARGRSLAAPLRGTTHTEIRPAGSDQGWASDLGSRAKRSGADGIVAIGGGRCLDVGKLAAARAGLILVVVPTQLSHDGICSPVAVVPNATGRVESLGAIAPRAVFVPIPVVRNASPRSLGAGLGDLLANPLALRDWALASERGLAEIDHRAWDMSVESFEPIKGHLDLHPSEVAGSPELLRGLADALLLSGTAMICSGTSRPASGGEHEISHAIDHLYGGRAMHGAQVALGCIVSVALYGEDSNAFRERLRRMDLPQHPGDIGLDQEAMIRVLLEAPNTRQGRFTVLEEADLDEQKARVLLRRIWGDG
jgi:glycerol-1-phosphate dehydrogenase [NAD(P)+]